MKKRWIAFVMLIVMVVTILPAGASAAAPVSGDCGRDEHAEDVHWSYADGVLTITGTGEMADFDDDCHTPWEAWCPQITKVVIGEGITEIGFGAFYTCTALRTLVLPASLSSFYTELNLISNCPDLEEIVLPEESKFFCVRDNVLYTKDRKELVYYPRHKTDETYAPAAETEIIRCYAFKGNKFLRTAKLPEGLKEIRNDAFRDCESLGNINIPGSVESLGNSIMDKTAFAENSANWDGDLLYLGSWLLTSKREAGPSITIREGTVGLAASALEYRRNLTSVTFPDSLRFLCPYCLSSTGAEEYCLPSHIENMEESVFSCCPNLKKVVLPADLTVIPYAAFYSAAALTDVTLPEGLKVISKNAFKKCPALKEIHIPAGVTEIGQYAFTDCPSLTDIYFGGSRMQWEAFCDKARIYDSGITTVHFGGDSTLSGTCGENVTWKLEGNTLTLSGTGATNDLAGLDAAPWSDHLEEIEKIIVTEGITRIGSMIFRDCSSATDIQLPESLTGLGLGAFRNCRSLEILRIPAGVSVIEPGISYECTSLTSIVVAPENKNYVSYDGILYTRDGSMLCSYPAGKQGDGYTLRPSVKAIDNYAFACNSYLRCLGIPSGIQTFGYNCFYCCCNLTDLYYDGSNAGWNRLSSGAEAAQDCAVHLNWKSGEEMQPTAYPRRSDNLLANNYLIHDHAIWSYLIKKPDGSLARVERMGRTMVEETYDAEKNITGHRVVARDELPLFGGFYEGEDYYFLVYGQTNPEESDEREVLRTVRYTKDWERVDSASLYGEKIYVPFEAGTLRMTQCGDYLYVITCRTIYELPGDEGVHHQDCYEYRIHIPTMTAESGEQWFSSVSHSFNQFIINDGSRIVVVNQGDARPRGILLERFEEDAAREDFTGKFGWGKVLLQFAGKFGDNYTGASVGGLEAAGDHYLVAGSSVEQKEEYKNLGQKNIYVCTVEREAEEHKTALHWLTDYGRDAGINITTPHMVKVGEDRLLLLWTENEGHDWETEELCYQFINSRGETVSPVYRKKDIYLSDCKPLVNGDEVLWYVTDHSIPVFYSIPLDRPEEIQIAAARGKSDAVPDNQCSGGLSCPSRKFIDVPAPDHWAHNGIDYAVSHGLFGGTGEFTFEPDTPMTRAMLVTVLWRYEGEPEAKESSFIDVDRSPKSWYINAVDWAAANGIVGGVGNNKFDPDGNVTREQMAAILYRYAGKKGFDTSRRGDVSGFPDKGRISRPWAMEPLQWTVAEKLIGGSDGYLLPGGNATRAQVATILMRFIQNIAEKIPA